MNPTRIDQGQAWAARNRAGESYSAIAQAEGLVSRNVVASAIRDYKREEQRMAAAEELAAPLTLDGDAVIVGDVHCPTHSERWVQRMMIIAERREVHRLIIAGDLINADAFSGYDPSLPSASFRAERDAARDFLARMLEHFGEVVIFPGNHERRLPKRTGAALNFTMLLDLLTGPVRNAGGRIVEKALDQEHLIASEWGHCHLISGGQAFRITHARNYGVNRLGVAGELALKYETNIINHHEHHLAMGYDRYGRYLIINNGGLFDASRLMYAILDDSKSPAMSNGFTVVKNGIPTLYGEGWFDWSEVE